ncbi:uncharacterized protein east isoform X2 [Planococcus citri]|uniref:uncharacterized protein east isoform X2 n=1 Tax=Planococcus citri TaxID=170843 RepID=UPI0031F81313
MEFSKSSFRIKSEPIGACNGIANVTSAMAVDSHEDNHYKLAIDNANNNSTNKALQRTTIKLESRDDDDFGLNPFAHDRSTSSLLSVSYSSDSSLLYQGSARRKNSTISKGIVFEEFISSSDRCSQLTPIDKLLLKNKAALQSLRMKPNRSKSASASAAAAGTVTTNGKSIKKEPKSRKEKVLGSKIAVAKKKVASAVNEAKPTTKSAPAVKKARNAAPPKVEETTKVKSRAKQTPQETKKVPKKEPANVPAAAATSSVARKRKADTTDSKPIMKITKKVNNNNNANKTERLTDLRSFKNVSRKTRSFNKVVKLRNGKSRIIQESKKTPPPSSLSRRKTPRNSNASTTESVASDSKPNTPFKRAIKQEPRDEDIGIKRKRRKTQEKPAPTEAPTAPVTPTVADTVKNVIEIKPSIESVPIPIETPSAPVLVKEDVQLPPLLEKPSDLETPAPSLTPAQLEPEPNRSIEDITVIDEELPNDAEMMVEEVLIDDEIESEPMTEDSCDPPVLSPAVPTVSTLDDTIVIDSSEDSDVQLIETPPVISPAAPVPVDDPPPIINKPDDQTEDTATEISEDTENDEEFPLQEINTESEGIIDEDITLHYETDDEDSTDKDMANEPTVAAVATAAHPIQEPKEPVESAREKIPTPPVTEVVEEPKVIATPSQEKPPKQPDTKVHDERPENKAVKESILGALGLTSLEKVQQKAKENNNYTGTLKAVIKIDKGCRRMELKPKDAGANVEGSQNENVLSFYQKIIPTKVEHGSDSGNGSMVRGDSETQVVNGMDSASFKNKCHDDGLLSSLREANARAMEADYNGMIDPVSGQIAKEKTKAAASLVVPEKSSSFSIHPNRLCSDVCKYCFGKFGSLDTPCHVGQMKNPERQRKILLCEPNLKLDTCLCDACYRFVDRKANKPPQKRSKSSNMRRSISINQRSLGLCVIQNCTQFARHTVKRKWLLRISKKIAKLSFDVNKGGPRMRYGLCAQHYYLVDFYTLCGICKKRLNRNHMYSIRSELDDYNGILKEDKIPIKLVDNMLLCKLCHYYMSLRLKYGESSRMSPSNRQYYQNFRKKILSNYNIEVSDSEDPITSECLKYESSGGMDSLNQGCQMIEELAASTSSSKASATAATTTTATSSARSANVSSSSSSSSSKKNNHNVGFRDIADLLKPLEGDGDKNSSTRIQVKFGNLNIGKLSNLNIGQNSSTHQSESKHDKSGSKELPLIADFAFKPSSAGQKDLEKCVSTILFDKGTKKLWQDLQKPYGNQSSFIRHLIMLEKFWRSGALVLAGNADAGAVKYINSVKNRIESLETSSSKESAPSATPPPPAATVTKPLPILKPATSSSMEIGTSTVHHFADGSIKKSPSETTTSTSANIRHTPPPPPPLLKIDSMNGMPFGVPNKVVVSSAESKVQYHHTPAAPKPAAPRNADISMQRYVEMMHPQPRTKHLAQMTNGNVKGLGVSLLKKPIPAMPNMKPIHIANSGLAEMMANSSASRISKKSASVVYHGTAGNANLAKRPYYSLPQLTAITTLPSSVSVSRTTPVDSSSMIIAKLPKALTVTQIDEPRSKDKRSPGEKPQLIPAPFLAGEKPSVSVFREMTK